MGLLDRAGPRTSLGLAAGLGFLLLLSGLASANAVTWTTQADFQSGTLNNVNATGSPGNLTLLRNATAFIPYAGNPIFSPSTSGWDDFQVVPGTILQVAGTWVMWYSGSANGTFYEVGRATSTDGIHWTRSPTTGIILAAANPYVLYEGGTYKMWYQHTPGAYQPTAIYYATSTDGMAWTPYAGNPILSPSASGFDSFVIAPAAILHDTSGYRMWFAGNDGIDTTYSVGLATSSDGIAWTRYPGNPIIAPPFGGWWATTRVLPSVVLPWKGGLLMGYIGTDYGYVQRMALATSSDGINWTSYPWVTLDVGPSGSWDGSGLSHFDIVPVAGNLTMWYGGGLNGRWQWGLAKAPAFGPVGTFTSPVIDSGSNGTTWASLYGNATISPANTVGFAARSGPTPTPDANWSSWYGVGLPGGSLGIPRSRYAQVRVSLATANGSLTPVFHDATLAYTLDRASAPDLVSPASGSWTNRTTMAFAWSFSDPDPGDSQAAFRLQVATDPGFTHLLLDSNNTTSSAGTATYPLDLPEGTYYWRVRTEDNWGVWGPYPAAASFGIDRTRPTVDVGFLGPTAIEGGTRFINYETLVFLNASDGAAGSGVAGVSYAFDGGAPSPYVVPFHPFVFSGTHFLEVTARDFAGNVATPLLVPFNMDDNGPVVTLGVTAAGDGDAVTVAGTDAGSGLATLYVSVDDGPWQTYTGTLLIDAAGDHSIRAYGVDNLGNQGATESLSFVIPNLKPYISGGIGILGIVVGALLVWRPRRGRWWPGAAVGLVGVGEIVVAAASAGTGALAIPPTVGVSLFLDVALCAIMAVLVALGWLPGKKSGTPPGPPAGGGEPPS